MSAHPERREGCLYVALSVNRDPSRRYLEFDRTEDHRGKEFEPKWITERDGYRLLEFPSPEAHAAALERITHLEAERDELRENLASAECSENTHYAKSCEIASEDAEAAFVAWMDDIKRHEDRFARIFAGCDFNGGDAELRRISLSLAFAAGRASARGAK